ncbi:helix-turn-helix transcriptional regulator [Elizabethkingia bruuniana]|uniref:Helix-turn-helix transcriptional regulator n=1 Tax=Elizabethkingia bruuniana TaxID=1756149 RepID=A0A7T7V109_9FLAO|nr:S24 family peptidase [Elizabethkingia bruuniana]KGO10019.1 hypothetical protein KS04_11135 [Elizabethkingia miricola]MDV3604158.1 hypothetical protein [Elizabethkingia anophelis]AQX86515.1 hypothetical protein AYC65_16565 [Elizabethkingia bruuniana]KUY27280.1 hypothetical protein ATB97_18825 [Elizabethkingia bruuniana]OPB61020.1 hypothetical protein BAY12_14690 [Elizabethkingia bruuniana]
MREKSILKERIMQYLDYKGIKRSKFYEDTGVSNGVLSQNNGLSEDNLMRFLNFYTEVNPAWLLTGSGNMLKKELYLYEKQVENLPDLKEEETVYKNDKTINLGIPLIPIDAMAGYGTGSMQIMDYETSYYEVPEFTELKAEFMIRVKGSSMYPKYSSGDLIACKKISSNTFFQWNKVYVLDTEQGALIKRVKKSQKENHILLVSDNSNYDPFDIHLDNIYSIACVLGVIRLE